MRRAFSQALMNAAEGNPKVAFITGDLGFQVFDDFQARYGQRYVNVGVAEAQMVYTAAGMASEGWRPVAYSIASFATGRPFEQIRYCVGYPRLPVVLVGAGRGFTYATSGVSHHALDDLGLMGTIPGMTVVAPGSPDEITQLLPQLLSLDGPAYISVGKFGEPNFAAEETAVIGRARRIRDGEGLAILSTGEIANEVVGALDVLAKQGMRPAAYQFHTVKPLDTTTLDRLANRFHTLLVVEEHLPQGGLWAGVCAWRAESDASCRLRRAGPPDAFALGNWKTDAMRERFGLRSADIAATASKLADRTP
jgi:transketolase